MTTKARRTMIKGIGAAMLTAGLPLEGATAEARTTTTPATPTKYKNHRFPVEIISRAPA